MLGLAKGIFFKPNLIDMDLPEKGRTDSLAKETELAERAKENNEEGSGA